MCGMTVDDGGVPVEVYEPHVCHERREELVM